MKLKRYWSKALLIGLVFLGSVGLHAPAYSAPQMTDNGAFIFYGLDLSFPAGTGTFQWTDPDSSSTTYWVYVGSTKGAFDFSNSGNIGNATFYSVDSLPQNGELIHVRLWYLPQNGSWQYKDHLYRSSDRTNFSTVESAVNSAIHRLETNGTFRDYPGFVDGNEDIETWVYAGSTPSGAQYFNSGNLGNNYSVEITGLPGPGLPYWVTLWVRVNNGSWGRIVRQFYTEASVFSFPTPLSSPSWELKWPLSTPRVLDGVEHVLDWSGISSRSQSITEYWVYAGSTSRGYQYFDSGSVGTDSGVTLENLPTDGSDVYVTLWYKTNGAWKSVVEVFTASEQDFPSMSSVDNFVNNTVGTCNDQDGFYGCQCVDLVHLYIDNVLGVPRNSHDIRGNAYPIYDNFPSSKTISSGSRSVRLEKIANTPSGIPRKGDIIFFSHSDGIGHVGVFLEGDANRFTSLDQNWFNANLTSGSPAAIVEHSYVGNYSVAGWLRPVLVSN